MSETAGTTAELIWHRALALDELPEGRVNTVTPGSAGPREGPLSGQVRRAGQSLSASGRASGLGQH